MEISKPCTLAAELAAHVRDARDDLTEHWIERIAAAAEPDGRPAFPAAMMRKRGPVLLLGIADYLEDPTESAPGVTPMIEEARTLGELRFAQGFDAGDILAEYEVLGSMLFGFAQGVIADSSGACTPEDVITFGHRMFRAISAIEQVTTRHYLRALGERVGEREERLRRFNRMITHELKNRVGATLGAGQLLQEEWLADEERRRFARMVTANAVEIQKVMEDLTALSRLDRERRRQRHTMLDTVIADVFQQLRELARGREVALRVGGELPSVEVNAAALELCLSNYVSNAIKYSDPDADERWVAVSAEVTGPAEGEAEGASLIVRVRDNGLGVPPEKRDRLFERFYRAHDTGGTIEGTGLGLSLVQETAAALGGRAWAEFEEEPGALFAFSVPCRHEGEQQFSCIARASGESRPARLGGEPATASD